MNKDKEVCEFNVNPVPKGVTAIHAIFNIISAIKQFTRSILVYKVDSTFDRPSSNQKVRPKSAGGSCNGKVRGAAVHAV